MKMERSFGIQLSLRGFQSTGLIASPLQKQRIYPAWSLPLLFPYRLHTCTICSMTRNSSSNNNTNIERLSITMSRLDKELKVMVQKASSLLAPRGHQVQDMFKVQKGTILIITAVLVAVAVLKILINPTDRTPGSVAELVKRGQLRSDRRSDSRLLKYEDPFNNPYIKVNEGQSVVKMYGKEFRMQPITLTKEKMRSHQNRRVQAYQWKRPTTFLVEGEPIPDGVDPDTVRWIPTNHPFATTKNDIDEEAAEKNIYQTRGIPSRVRAEHEALRKQMLEAAEEETTFQFIMEDPLENSERKTNKKVVKPLQQDSGLGTRPIKPFENPNTNVD